MNNRTSLIHKYLKAEWLQDDESAVSFNRSPGQEPKVFVKVSIREVDSTAPLEAYSDVTGGQVSSSRCHVAHKTGERSVRSPLTPLPVCWHHKLKADGWSLKRKQTIKLKYRTKVSWITKTLMSMPDFLASQICFWLKQLNLQYKHLQNM